MKIVITGALGHIGSRLIRDLPYTFPDSEVVMVDNLMTQRYCSLFNLPKVGNYRFIEGDITQMDLHPLLEGAHVVVHLAAITDAAGSFDRAEMVELNNFNATRRLAEACSELGVRLITLSSTSVYGTQADLVDEDCTEEELKPQSPYAITKLKEERLIQSFVKDRKLPATIFRFGTIFGTSSGMRFHTAVSKFCWQAVMGMPISVWRTAYDQKRPYLDINDAVNAVTHVIKNELFSGDIYNIVTTNVTVRHLVDSIKRYIPKLKVELVDNPIMNVYSYDVCSNRFAKTGFKYHGDLAGGITDTINILRISNSK